MMSGYLLHKSDEILYKLLILQIVPVLYTLITDCCLSENHRMGWGLHYHQALHRIPGSVGKDQSSSFG